MKFSLLIITGIILFSGFSFRSPADPEFASPADVEFVCMKTHKASNTCYFNFKIDGGKYCYTDVGCKKAKKKKEVIREVKEGKIALSRNWKIECNPEE